MNRNKPCAETLHILFSERRNVQIISIGIDVSKGKSTVCIMKPYGEVLKRAFEMLHSMDELLNLIELIQSLLHDSASNHKLTDFVKRYYHFRHILEMGEKCFTSDYCKWSKKQGYRMHERLAEKIFAMVQNSNPCAS